MRILLIEDETEIAKFIASGLKTEGYQITHVENAENGIGLMGQDIFDILILDLLLPGMSGEDMLRKIRSEGNNIPVIVLTSVTSSDMKVRLLNAGADDYLVKPFSFIELSARIKSVFRRVNGDAQQCDELSVGDIRLIPKMRMVTRAGRPIRLRLREYVLLEYFMRHPNEVINRNTLIENIWDYNSHLLSNTVDSHVSLLRKKLNEGFDDRLIETVHGVGYVLRVKG